MTMVFRGDEGRREEAPWPQTWAGRQGLATGGSVSRAHLGRAGAWPLQALAVGQHRATQPRVWAPCSGDLVRSGWSALEVVARPAATKRADAEVGSTWLGPAQ